MRRRLTESPGIKTDFIGNGDGTGVIHSYGDAGPLLERNARRYDGDRMARRKSTMREVAQIDPVTFVRWMREEGMTMADLNNQEGMHKFLRKKLNDPDNRKFRTGPEKL